MKRAMVAVAMTAAILACVVSAHAWPLNEDWGYGAYRQAPCTKCVPCARPMLSSAQWIITPGTLERQPQKPWLTILVNGRDAGLGKLARFVSGEMMLPVTCADEFGLVDTRSALNHRMITLTGGRYLVRLIIGSKKAEIGYAVKDLPVAPSWQEGKVYMPIQTIGECLDWEAYMNAGTGVLHINTTGPDALSHRNAGMWAQERKLYDEALAEYAKAAALDPADWTIPGRMGDVHFAAALFNDGLASSHAAIREALQRVAEYKRSVETHPNTGKDRYVAAVEQAAALVRAYAQFNAKNYPLTQVRQPDQVLDTYAKVLKPDKPCASLRVANTEYIHANALNDAIASAAAAERDCRTRSQNSYKAAASQYKAAADLAPATIAQFRNLAKTYTVVGDHAEAAKAYRNALAIDPQFASVRIELTGALIDLDKFAEAAEEAERALALAPNSARAYNLLGYALYQDGQKTRALEAYKKAVGNDPHYALAQHNLGVALLAEDDVKGAKAAFAAAVAAEPNRAEFQADYAFVLQRLGGLYDASAAWRKAVTLEPTNGEYHAYLASCLFGLAKVEAALAEGKLALDRLTRGDSQVADAKLAAQATVAMALLEKGRVADALAAARDAAGLSSKHILGHVTLAAVNVEKLDAAAALKALAAAPEAGRDRPEYLAVQAAAKALAQQATSEELLAAVAAAAAVSDRWTWYFIGRASATMGMTDLASDAFSKPMPTSLDPARASLVADYLKRHPAKEGGVIVPPPAQSVPIVLTVEPTEAGVEIASLKIVNQSEAALTILIGSGADEHTVWTVGAGQTSEGPLAQGLGEYTVKVTVEGTDTAPSEIKVNADKAAVYTVTIAAP